MLRLLMAAAVVASVSGGCPESYDARRRQARYPECISRAVIDQGECESCYALAVSGATSDRLCLSNAKAAAGSLRGGANASQFDVAIEARY